MIQNVTVNGRPAIAMYMDKQFQPVIRFHCSSLSQNRFLRMIPEPQTNQHPYGNRIALPLQQK
jgi:hypothetical protein